MKIKSVYLVLYLKLLILCILLINYVESNSFKVELSSCDNDTTKYIKIDSRGIEILACSPGLNFNEHSKNCERGKTGSRTNIEANSNIVCPPDLLGPFPYPNDCTKFIKCTNGQLHKMDCSANTSFHRNQLYCDHKYNVHCDWNGSGATPSQSPQHTSDILCPKDITGLFVYPYDFKKYINCVNGKTWIQNCAKGTKFSITNGECMTSDDIGTTDFVKYEIKTDNLLVYETLYECPKNVQPKNVYPFEATKYINCSTADLKIISCALGEVFSISKLECLPKDSVANSDRVPSITDTTSTSNPIDEDDDDEESIIPGLIYCTMDLFGLYPHPFDNTKYLKCVYGRLYSLSCRSGYVYSLSRKFCDIKSESLSFDILQVSNTNSQIETRLEDGLTYLKCPSNLSGKFVFPFTCTKYVQCSEKGETKIITCPNTSIYSIRNGRCEPAKRVDENDHVECLTGNQEEFENTPYSLGVFCSPSGSSVHPHPQDWHYYVRCDNGKLTVKRCRRNKIFSLKDRKCVEEPIESEEIEG